MSPQVPVNERAERAVLGACLADATCYWRSAQIVTASDFYASPHQLIFGAMCELSRANVGIDLLTVCDYMGQRGLLEKVGGASYVSSVTEGLQDTVNVEHYARMVRDVSLKREVLRMAVELQGLAAGDEGTGAAALEKAQASLLQIGQRMSSDVVKLDALLDRVCKNLEKEYTEQVKTFEIGLTDLDRLLHGHHRGELTVIAAESGVGKTALALTLAAKAAKAGKRVLVFSEEMTADSLARRLLASESHIHNYRVQTGRIAAGEWRDVAAAKDRLNDFPLFTYEGIGTTTAKIRAVARAVQMRLGLDLIVVDYLQIITTGTRQENRTQEVTAVARDLKSIAKDLNVPLLTASQVNPDGEVRESRAIRHYADNLLRMTTDDAELNDVRTVTIEVVKQRNGPQGKGVEARLLFHPPFVSYEDYRPERAREANAEG